MQHVTSNPNNKDVFATFLFYVKISVKQLHKVKLNEADFL